MKNQIPTLFQSSIVKILQSKSEKMDYDEFNHYFVKFLILPYSRENSKNIRNDICIALGNCKDDISVIYKRLKLL